MTHRKALHILIEAAAKYSAGSGTGICSVPSAAERDSIRAAVAKVWPTVYGFAATDQDLSNLGLR
jgi:hypothetical protein